LSNLNVKLGKLLPSATAKKVNKFCVSDEISKMMPEAKDYVSVNSEDKKLLSSEMTDIV
jgi:hypothetical protein